MGQDKEVTIHIPITTRPALGDKSFNVVLDDVLNSRL